MQSLINRSVNLGLISKLAVIFLLFVTTIESSLAETKTKDSGVTFVQCGGTIQSDSGSLTYPEAGEVIVPGQVCVWTIHLDTTENFRITLDNLNLSANKNQTNPNNTNCSNEGLRVYSLTNLVSAGNQQNYTFCDQESSSNTFFLSNSLATIVFYTSKSSNISSNSTGFTISWEGTNYDRLQTKHISSFSTSPSGVIRYPVVGSYESNLVSTWSISPNNDDGSPLDIILESIALENCSNSLDTCLCDALIVFEVSTAGLVTENQRFCGSLPSPVEVNQNGSQFILAFFTDSDAQKKNSSSTGFELVYYPQQIIGTTTTKPTNGTTTFRPPITNATTTFRPPITNATTTFRPPITNATTTLRPTTTERPGAYSDKCGGILFGLVGTIYYKQNSSVRNDDACMWTIRARQSTEITFNLTELSFNHMADGIFLSTFSRDTFQDFNDSLLHDNRVLRQTGSVTMKGGVAIVTLATVYGFQDRYFKLEWSGSGVSGDSPHSQDHYLSQKNGSLSYPVEKPLYNNAELSTFTLPIPENSMDPWYHLTLQVSLNDDGEHAGLEPKCFDEVRIYEFESFYTGLKFVQKLCYEDLMQSSWTAKLYNLGAVVFSSDNAIPGSGFALNWNWNLTSSNLGHALGEFRV